MNSALLEFDDGHRMVASRQGLQKARNDGPPRPGGGAALAEAHREARELRKQGEWRARKWNETVDTIAYPQTFDIANVEEGKASYDDLEALVSQWNQASGGARKVTADGSASAGLVASRRGRHGREPRSPGHPTPTWYLPPAFEHLVRHDSDDGYSDAFFDTRACPLYKWRSQIPLTAAVDYLDRLIVKPVETFVVDLERTAWQHRCSECGSRQHVGKDCPPLLPALVLAPLKSPEAPEPPEAPRYRKIISQIEFGPITWEAQPQGQVKSVHSRLDPKDKHQKYMNPEAVYDEHRSDQGEHVTLDPTTVKLGRVKIEPTYIPKLPDWSPERSRVHHSYREELGYFQYERAQIVADFVFLGYWAPRSEQTELGMWIGVETAAEDLKLARRRRGQDFRLPPPTDHRERLEIASERATRTEHASHSPYMRPQYVPDRERPPSEIVLPRGSTALWPRRRVGEKSLDAPEARRERQLKLRDETLTLQLDYLRLDDVKYSTGKGNKGRPLLKDCDWCGRPVLVGGPRQLPKSTKRHAHCQKIYDAARKRKERRAR